MTVPISVSIASKVEVRSGKEGKKEKIHSTFGGILFLREDGQLQRPK